MDIMFKEADFFGLWFSYFFEGILLPSNKYEKHFFGAYKMGTLGKMGE